MPNISNIPESLADFWWSYDPRKMPADSQIDNFSEDINNRKLLESTLIATSKEYPSGNSQATGPTEEVIQKCEETYEDTKNNKSNIKRPSGAQRRKRKWLRFEIHKESTDLNAVQDGLKKLNINEVKVDSVTPSFSRKEVQFHVNQTIENKPKVPFSQFKKQLNRGNSFKNGNSKVESIPGRSMKEDEQVRWMDDKYPRHYKRKFKGYSDQSDQNENKRSNYSAALKNELNAVIFDESHIEGALSFEQSYLIIDKLMTKLSEYSSNEDFEVPRFQGYHLNRGVLTVNCVNDNSLDWLMNMEFKELWDGAKIKIMKANEFVKSTRVTAFFPGPFRENSEILKLLKTQNPELNTSRWKIYHRSQGASTGVTLVLGVDDKTLQVLSSLEMNPYYGMSRATFELPDNRRTPRNSSPRKVIQTARHV